MANMRGSDTIHGLCVKGTLRAQLPAPSICMCLDTNLDLFALLPTWITSNFGNTDENWQLFSLLSIFVNTNKKKMITLMKSNVKRG